MTETVPDDLDRPDNTLPPEAQTLDAQADADNPQGTVTGEDGAGEGGPVQEADGSIQGTVANQSGFPEPAQEPDGPPPVEPEAEQAKADKAQK